MLAHVAVDSDHGWLTRWYVFSLGDGGSRAAGVAWVT
jgi:hypothetical protein